MQSVVSRSSRICMPPKHHLSCGKAGRNTGVSTCQYETDTRGMRNARSDATVVYCSKATDCAQAADVVAGGWERRGQYNVQTAGWGRADRIVRLMQGDVLDKAARHAAGTARVPGGHGKSVRPFLAHAMLGAVVHRLRLTTQRHGFVCPAVFAEVSIRINSKGRSARGSAVCSS